MSLFLLIYHHTRLFLFGIGLMMFASNGCALVAQTADSLINPLSSEGPYHQDVSAQAEQLHRTLFVGDLHADTLLWERNLLEKHTRGHVDVPRLIEGNVSIQAFTVFTKIPFPIGGFFRHPGSNATIQIMHRMWPRCWPWPNLGMIENAGASWTGPCITLIAFKNGPINPTVTSPLFGPNPISSSI